MVAFNIFLYFIVMNFNATQSNPCLKLDMVFVSVVECMTSLLMMMYWIERTIVLKCFCLNCLITKLLHIVYPCFFCRSDIIHITSWLPAFLG